MIITRVFLRRSKVTGILLDFLLISTMNEPEKKHRLVDLLTVETYMTYEQNISSDLISKFNDIFSLAVFNYENDSNRDLFNFEILCIINLGQMSSISRNALVILMRIAQQYNLLP